MKQVRTSNCNMKIHNFVTLYWSEMTDVVMCVRACVHWNDNNARTSHSIHSLAHFTHDWNAKCDRNEEPFRRLTVSLRIDVFSGVSSMCVRIACHRVEWLMIFFHVRQKVQNKFTAQTERERGRVKKSVWERERV